MEHGGKEETDADLLNTAADLRRGQVKVDAQGFQDIGAAAPGRDGAVAVLGHRDTGRRDHKGRRCRDVEGAGTVAAGAAGVNEDLKAPIWAGVASPPMISFMTATISSSERSAFSITLAMASLIIALLSILFPASSVSGQNQRSMRS